MITQAAIKFENDDCSLIVWGKNHERHSDIYDRVTSIPNFHILDYKITEGFLGEVGTVYVEKTFYNRERAWYEAILWGQIPSDAVGTQLYTEDLW